MCVGVFVCVWRCEWGLFTEEGYSLKPATSNDSGREILELKDKLNTDRAIVWSRAARAQVPPLQLQLRVENR